MKMPNGLHTIILLILLHTARETAGVILVQAQALILP